MHVSSYFVFANSLGIFLLKRAAIADGIDLIDKITKQAGGSGEFRDEDLRQFCREGTEWKPSPVCRIIREILAHGN